MGCYVHKLRNYITLVMKSPNYIQIECTIKRYLNHELDPNSHFTQIRNDMSSLVDVQMCINPYESNW